MHGCARARLKDARTGVCGDPLAARAARYTSAPPCADLDMRTGRGVGSAGQKYGVTHIAQSWSGGAGPRRTKSLAVEGAPACDGRLALIDFGLCAEIAQFDARQLTSALVHLMRGEP